MTSYERGEKPDNGTFLGFDHIRFYVGNAKQRLAEVALARDDVCDKMQLQAAFWYCAHYGFEPFAYRGLETGHRKVAAHAIRQNKIIFVFESALLPNNHEIGVHLMKHGDEVKDVAFEVDGLDKIVKTAKAAGATIVQDVTEESDEHGTIRFATVQTFGDTTHTLIERKNYHGLFLPGFQPHPGGSSAIFKTMPPTHLECVDHTVGNQPDQAMEAVVQWYEKVFTFHRFWSADETVIHADYSALRSVIMTNWEETIKMPMTEPAKGKYRAVSQIQEFVDFNDGPGTQHIAMHTNDIIASVAALRARGVEFLSVPSIYYEDLKERLKTAKITVTEDMDRLEQQQILVDFDEHGYILQILSKPCEDRPTLFTEIIQRHNHGGFGAGNFKALFGALEREQKTRDNLFYEDFKKGDRGIKCNT